MVSTNLARSTGQRAIEQALALEFELTDLCPNAWQLADSLIGNPCMPTRPWCLLPIEAYAMIALREGLSGEEAGQTAPLLAAFHHWRHTRSVYIFNPEVWTDIFAPDRLGPVARIEDFQFPEWCACFGVAGNTLLTLTCTVWSVSSQEPLLIVLSCTDDLCHTTADVFPLNGSDNIADLIAGPMHEVRAHMPPTGSTATDEETDREAVEQFAVILARHINPAVHLARPGADITAADSTPARPMRSPRQLAAEDHRVWLVGYTDHC